MYLYFQEQLDAKTKPADVSSYECDNDKSEQQHLKYKDITGV